VARWSKSGNLAAAGRPSRAADPAPPAARDPGGEYGLLHKYLRDRYANRIVLTFAQIEDLIGFPLPALARRQADWWGGADPTAHHSPQVDAWTLASRTATVNLLAQCVVFER
jgi:hypothetical protein